MTPAERKAKRARVKRVKHKGSDLWITDPICPIEKIRTATREVDGLHWLQMEAERWGDGVEIRAVDGGKMVLAKKRG